MVNPLEKLIVTQRFGENMSYYSKFGLYKGHEGLDLKTRNLGTSQGLFSNLMGWQKVFAVCDGTVVVKYDGPYGTHIYLRSKAGDTYLYAHLKNARCSTGQSVLAGDIIAVSGNSGNSENSHLHFGYRPADYKVNNGYFGYVDPLPLFQPVGKPFTMAYTVFNTDPSILEQARQLLLSYSQGKVDCSFIHMTIPDLSYPTLFTTENQMALFKKYPTPTPFIFLTYQSLADPGMVNMVTKEAPGTPIVTACKGTPTAFNVCYEFTHALTFYLLDRGFPIGIPLDVNTPTEEFLKQKLNTVLKYLRGGDLI